MRSFFETASRRLKLENPMDDLDEVRFRQKAPTRLYLAKTEAGILFSAIERAAQAPPERASVESIASAALGRWVLPRTETRPSYKDIRKADYLTEHIGMLAWEGRLFS